MHSILMMISWANLICHHL